MYQLSQVARRGHGTSSWRRRRDSRWGDHDQGPFLVGDEKVSVAEAVQDHPLERGDRWVHVRKAPAGCRQSNLVAAGEIEPERLGPRHQLAQVGISAEQIIDKVPPKRLFATQHLTPGRGVTLGESCHGILHDSEDCVGCGAHSFTVSRSHDSRQFTPYPPCGGQVQTDALAGGDARVGGAAAELLHRLQFLT